MEFRDLKTQYQRYKTEINYAINRVLSNANFIGGEEVGQLEKTLAEYVGVKHCISCANGTDAMTLVMMAWDIKEGDAVFVPDFTFFSTGEIVAFRGATPVFVDVDFDTFNMDPEKLELAIEKVLTEGRLRPRVVVPVDMFGLPADYARILDVAKKYEMLVLEDGAQGFGGRIGNKKACSFGDVATTSFFPAKPLGCYGDGGAIFTNDDRLADVIKSLKVHGKGEDKYDNVRIGLNSRLDTMQAAVLNVKFEAFIRHELHDVNNVCRLYSERLDGLVHKPAVPTGYYSSFAQYTIKLKNSRQRAELQEHLKENHIPTMIYYLKPMHKQKAFATMHFDDSDFEVTDKLCGRVLSLPMHPYLTEKDVDAVCSAIRSCLK